jgi:hypothetical protein
MVFPGKFGNLVVGDAVCPSIEARANKKIQ